MTRQIDDLWGPIRRSDTSRGWRLPRAVLNRFLHCLARYVPMAPGMRAAIHRLRGVRVGRRVFIGTEVFIDDSRPDLVLIEDDVTIIARATILAHATYPSHLRQYLAEAENREGVVIRRGAYLGVGATVLPGVTVGEDAVIGAGAVVVRDAPPRTVLVGVPARPVRTLDAESTAVNPGVLSA